MSISTPGVYLGDGGDAFEIAKQVNEFSAELVKGRPDRFGFFATLTLPNVDSALAAAAYALDELHADGIVLLASSRGTYLGDPSFDPLLEELNRREAVVFVHPAELPGPEVPGIPPFAADFLLDTARTAVNLVRHDVPRRFPDIKFILAHAGGFVPYTAHRSASTTPTASARSQFLVFQADLVRGYFGDDDHRRATRSLMCS